MKIGDKVRYLNAVGGGVITRIGEKGVVTVLEEDGFETPVLANDVVVVADTNELNFVSESKSKPNTTTTTRTDEKPQYKFDIAEETPEGEAINVSLAFVPVNIKSLQNTDMEMFVINESNYYIDFQILTGNATVSVHTSDTIEPQTKLFITDVRKDEVNDYEFIRFQGFAYKQTTKFDAKPALDVAVRINPVDFYKLHRFEENDFFEAKAMLVNLIENDYPPIKYLIDDKQLQDAMHDKRPQPTKRQFAPPRKSQIIEVDLHIHELIDNFANLDNADMLRIQLDKFHSVMKENINKKGQKIVFIHGKGEGVLRKEITELLRKQYKNASFQDASFQQYGFGATQVNIH